MKIDTLERSHHPWIVIRLAELRILIDLICPTDQTPIELKDKAVADSTWDGFHQETLEGYIQLQSFSLYRDPFSGLLPVLPIHYTKKEKEEASQTLFNKKAFQARDFCLGL